MNEKHFDLIADRVTPFLAESLKEDIRTIEIANVTNRTIGILESKLPSVDLSAPVIKAGLQEFFIKKTAELLAACESSISLELEPEQKKLENIAMASVRTLLNGELFKEDSEWLQGYMEGIVRRFFYDLTKHYFDAYFQKIEFAMVKNWEDAELMMFGKEQSRFTMKELDQLLKKGNGFNAWLMTKKGKGLIIEDIASDYLAANPEKVSAEGYSVQKLVNGAKACNWLKEFRDYCLERFGKK